MTATLIAYRTPPQMERKALAEAREAGHRAYLPRERIGARNVPTARGYVFCEGKPADADHIKNAIGPVSRTELRRLYVRSSVTQRRHKFSPGDQVSVKRGRDADLAATVVEVIRSGWYRVRVSMFGKTHEIKIKESDLARLHPGTK
jgi:transcription antitermination factor NusG